MRNFVQQGDAVYLPAPYDVKSGDVVVSGQIVGIASVDALMGEVLSIEVHGIYSLPKKTGEAWGVGVAIYWDAVNKWCSVVGTGLGNSIGVATPLAQAYTAAAASAATVGDVRLNPSFPS